MTSYDEKNLIYIRSKCQFTSFLRSGPSNWSVDESSQGHFVSAIPVGQFYLSLAPIPLPGEQPCRIICYRTWIIQFGEIDPFAFVSEPLVGNAMSVLDSSNEAKGTGTSLRRLRADPNLNPPGKCL